MASSDLAPTATGKVSVDHKGANTRLDVKVDGLAAPEQANAGQRVYVLWAQPIDERQAPANLGAIMIDQNQHGELKTVTPLRRFSLFITPEATPQVAAPSGPKVLATDVAPKLEHR